MYGSVRIDRATQHIMFWTVVLGITASAAVAGLTLRRYAWEKTDSIRYTEDINNAFRQGTEAMRVGYLNRYDQDHTSKDWWRSQTHMELDYAPGRLAIAELWARWVHERVDGPLTDETQVRQWPYEFYDRARSLKKQYQLCAPMLRVNLTGEAASALALFLLVRRYTGGRNGPPLSTPLRDCLRGGIVGVTLLGLCMIALRQFELPLMFGWQLPGLVWLWVVLPSRRSTLMGLVAALFFWFNPALIWNAHCWPQWDSWVLPFFLWAVLAGSLDYWFVAGALVAAGAMFKGQILFGAPLLLLWPLFQLRFISIVRWLVGLATSTAVITSPWLLRTAGATPGMKFVPGHLNQESTAWVMSVAVAFGLMIVLLRGRWLWYAKLPVLAVVAGLISWHFLEVDSTPQLRSAILFGLSWAALVPVLLWPRFQAEFKIPAVIGLTCFVAYGASHLGLVWLRTVDAGLVIAGAFVSAELLASHKFLVKADHEAPNPLFVGHRVVQGLGIFLGIFILFVPIRPAFVPALYSILVMLSGGLIFWGSLRVGRWSWQTRLPVGWLLTSLVLWPFLDFAQGMVIAAVAATFRVGLIIFYAPRRALPYTAAGWIAAALLLCVPLFDGSRTWFDVGLASPTTYRQAMASGENDNLPDILSEQWRWQTMDTVVTIEPGTASNAIAAFLEAVDPRYRHRAKGPIAIPMKYLLVSMWAAAVLLSSIGASVHDAGRRSQFLIAIAAPWIVMFAVMAQMHQRYLLWGASLSSAAAALNPGYALLHLLISLVAMSQEIQSMLERNPFLLGELVRNVIRGWHPGIGWAVLLIAIIFVYAAARPERSRNSPRR